VRLAGARVKSFTDNLIVTNDNRTDHRIRFRLTPPEARELEGPRHVSLVSR
jgi:hypothetical protein